MIYRVLAPSKRWLFGISEPSTVSGYFWRVGSCNPLSCWSWSPRYLHNFIFCLSAYALEAGDGGQMCQPTSFQTHMISTGEETKQSWRISGEHKLWLWSTLAKHIKSIQHSVPFFWGWKTTTSILMSTDAPKSGRLLIHLYLRVSAISFHQQNQKRQWNGIIL